MIPMRCMSGQERSAASSTPDKSPVEDKSTSSSPVLQPYTREHSISFQSLPTIVSRHDDLPSPAPGYCQTSYSSSPNWSPTTPTSSPLGNRLPSSHLVSPSVSPTDAQCQLQPSTQSQPLEIPSTPYSSYPPIPRFRSTTGSETQFPPQTPPRNKSRPSTAPQPHSPSNPFGPGDSGISEMQRKNRGISPWLAVGIKGLLSKPAQPSQPRHSICSTPPASPARFPVQHVSRKSRPPDLDVAACPSSSSHSGTSTDVYHRSASDGAKVPGSVSSLSPLSRQDSHESPVYKSPAIPRKPNVLRRRPSGSAKSLRDKRDKATTLTDQMNLSCEIHDAPSLPSPSLFKLGQKNHVGNRIPPEPPIIKTYIQQEVFRDGNDTQKLSVDARHEIRDQNESNADANANVAHGHGCLPTPYYTVFGSSPDWRVAAGGPNDHCIGPESYAPAAEREKVTQANSGSRSLTRKVSTRWKRMIGSSQASEFGPSSPSPRMGHSKRRASLQEWSGGRVKERGRCTGKSMDGMAELIRRDEAWAGPAAGREKPRPDAEKTDSNANEAEESGKLWKLVKRISTGSLRERFHAERDSAVPPVPAIPKEHLQPVGHTSHPGQFQGATIHWTRTVPDPLSHNRSSSFERYRDRFPSQSQSTPFNSPLARSSVTTTSPSPNSSDVASAQFFQRPQSVRSSISSYGEANVPPVPELDRHIIPPSEQLRLADDQSVKADITPPQSPFHRATFLPPAQMQNDAETDGPSQPTSSTGSNTSTSHVLLADGGVALSPPPRHPRSKLRSANSSRFNSSPSPSTKLGEGDSEVSQHGELPTVLRSSLEQPQMRSRFTFRELDGPRRPPLSEREKEDIWDDLLARSERAGGTLHLGSGGLMSDSLRLSTFSDNA